MTRLDYKIERTLILATNLGTWMTKVHGERQMLWNDNYKQMDQHQMNATWNDITLWLKVKKESCGSLD